MKVILSRKGFDSSNGGIPSPILPDGTLLSFPIPACSDELTFDELYYEEIPYSQILEQLKGYDEKQNHFNCHLDPDIRADVCGKAIPNWSPAFGQIKLAQGLLRNKGVTTGDLFLYFGWFRQTEGNIVDGTLHFKYGAPDLNIIYGYLQIGDIMSDSHVLMRKYPWHPHASQHRVTDKTNMLYIPTKFLSFNDKYNCSGIFKFSEERVLTMEGKTRGTWKEVPALSPENMNGIYKNSSKTEGNYYAGIWQEKVLLENELSEDWAKKLFDSG